MKTLRIEDAKIEKLFFVLAIGLKPLYLWKSGSLQISDMLFIAGFAISVFRTMKFSYQKETARWLLLFLSMIAYQAVINLVWTFVLKDQGLMVVSLNRYTLYYLFNFFVVLFSLNLYTAYGFDDLRDLIIKGMLLSGLVAAIGIVRDTSTSVRMVGFFQNPNQLGYFAVILITVALYFKEQMKKPIMFLLLGIGMVCVIASLSKAALISSAVLLVLNTAFSPNTSRDKKVVIRRVILLIAVFAVLYVLMFSDISFLIRNRTIMSMRRRLLNLSAENDSSLGDGRGYNRLKEIGSDVVWGVGEGAYYRFISRSGVEVHSTYVNMLVCYGIIGTVGYGVIWWRALFSCRQRFYRFIAFSGILLYGLSHNGIRNTLLWVLLAAFFIENIQQNKEDPREALQAKSRRFAADPVSTGK